MHVPMPYPGSDRVGGGATLARPGAGRYALWPIGSGTSVMKLAIVLGFALAAASVAPSLGREAATTSGNGMSLPGRVDEPQEAAVQGMRARGAAGGERRQVDLTAEINTLQEALVEVMRNPGALD